MKNKDMVDRVREEKRVKNKYEIDRCRIFRWNAEFTVCNAILVRVRCGVRDRGSLGLG